MRMSPVSGNEVLQSSFDFDTVPSGHNVERPEVSLSLLCAASLWVAAALILWAGRTWEVFVCIVVGIIASISVVISLLLFIFWAKGAARVVCACLMGACLGAACGSIQAGHMHQQQEAVHARHAYEYTLQIMSDPTQSEFGQSCYAKNLGGSNELFKLYIPADAQVFTWDVVHVHGTAKDPKDQVQESAWRNGYVATVVSRSMDVLPRGGVSGAITNIRISALNLFEEADPDSSGSMLMKALVCGWRSELFQSETYESVKTVGLAHLVAVSGSHLVLMTGFFAWLLSIFGFSKKITVICQIAFIGMFIIFTGAPVSVLRASVMACCALMAFFAKRRAARMHALGLCIMAIILINPQNALSVSFALSAAATAGILFFARYISSWLSTMCAGYARRICDVIGMTCAATFFTIPISTSIFSQLPLVSPLSNLIATPFFSVLCAGGLVGVLLSGLAQLMPQFVLLKTLALGITHFVCVIATSFVQVIEKLSTIPYACIPFSMNLVAGCIAVVVISVMLLIFWPKPSIKYGWEASGVALTCAIVFLFVLPCFTPERIVALDVGQGDAILIQSKNHAVLVDTGKPHTGVVSGLARQHVRQLDAVLITHHDDDHFGALSEVLRCVPTKQVLVASDALSCTCENCRELMAKAQRAPVQGLDVGDTFRVGEIQCRVLSPSEFRNEGGNEDSIVLKVTAPQESQGALESQSISGSRGTSESQHTSEHQSTSGSQGTSSWTALLTGDAENEVISELCKDGSIGQVDIFKVGHHGSRAAVDDETAQALSPAISLVSVGEGNRYGHPNAQTVESLLKSGSRVERTDEHGDIVCELNDTQIRVRTQR